MEFIENAEGFYNGITFLKRALLDVRVKKDEKKEREMISEMESYLFHLKQFLGTILERKANIVDLGEVWHSKDITPKENEKVIAITKHDIAYAGNYRNEMFANNGGLMYHSGIWVDELVLEWRGVKRWAYIEDLLPKGGEGWNTTK